MLTRRNRWGLPLSQKASREQGHRQASMLSLWDKERSLQLDG